MIAKAMLDAATKMRSQLFLICLALAGVVRIDLVAHGALPTSD
jgi:hypothetical protein